MSIHQNIQEDREEERVLCKCLPLDTVQSKDQMDSESHRRLSYVQVIDTLPSFNYTVHTLVPEKWKYSEDNIQGVFQGPVSVNVGPVFHLVLDACVSLFFSMRLHYPAQVKKLYNDRMWQRPHTFYRNIPLEALSAGIFL